jgi:ElaB/YqjD/DUF883 family membrane-anchored ribosome-binding protein
MQLESTSSGPIDGVRDGAMRAERVVADSLLRARETVSDLGHDGAKKVAVAARYMRDRRPKDVVADVEEVVRAHPAKALLAAAAVGFMAARVFRRG